MSATCYKKYILFLLPLFLLYSLIASGQVNNYIFSTIPGTYTPISDGTELGTKTNNNESFNNISLGFNFYFNGKIYNKVSVNVNGFIAMGEAVINSTAPISSGLSNNIVCGFGLDLKSGNLVPGELRYSVGGTAPNRVFTVQWSNYYSSASNDTYSFQIRLLENGNIAEVVYGDIVQSSSIKYVQVGLRGNSNSDYNNRSVSSSINNTWATSVPGTGPGATCELSNTGKMPVAGLTFRWELPAIDLGLTSLLSPSGCFGADQKVRVFLTNLGKNQVDFQASPVTCSGSVSGPNPKTFQGASINYGKLNPGSSIIVSLDTAYDMISEGDYFFSASISSSVDQFAGNNHLSSVKRTVAYTTISELPVKADFTEYNGDNLKSIFPGWYEANGTRPVDSGSAWVASSGAQRAFFGKDAVAAKVRLYTNFQNEWIIGPRFKVEANTYLRYKAAVTSSGDIASAQMGADDKLYVMVSPDCGANWIVVDSIVSSMLIPPDLTLRTISLAEFSGQDLMPAFFATDGLQDNTESYDLHVDGISIGNLADRDASVVAVLSPYMNNCANKNAAISVLIENTGLDSLTDLIIRTTISGMPKTVVLLDTLKKTLQPAEWEILLLSEYFDSNPGGLIDITSSVISGDSNPSNDSASIDLFINSNPPAPVAQDEIICEPGGTATLHASGQGTMNWYDKSENGTLLYNGPYFTTPYLTESASYYVRSALTSPNNLRTVFDGQNQASGNMFDLTALVSLRIDSFDVHLPGFEEDVIKIYYKEGTYEGFENNESAWTFFDSVTVWPNGLGLPTRVPFGNLFIPAGKTYGLYITCVRGSMRYTATSGIHTISDGNMLLKLGIGNTYPFTSIYTPRSWNGTIYYTYACESEAERVDVTVKPCETAVNEHGSNIRLMPNPSEGIVYINHGSYEKASAEVIDTRGRTVLRQQIEEQHIQTKIDARELAPGVYFLRLTTSGEQFIHKLILRR